MSSARITTKLGRLAEGAVGIAGAAGPPPPQPSAASAPRITPRAATVAAAPDLTPNATWRDALAAEHTATVNPPPGSFCQVRLLQRQRSHRDTEPQRFEVDVAE